VTSEDTAIFWVWLCGSTMVKIARKTTSSTMASLVKGSRGTPKAIAYDDPAMESQIPEDAWIITVWLKEVRGLVYGMSGDVGGQAVNIHPPLSHTLSCF
jgi:hypothetical protein